MIKRRIDEDFKHVWAINWNGLPEDFSDATEIVLTASVYGKKKQLERGIDYVIEGNLIIVDFTPRFATIAGIYNLELKYIKPSDGFIDGERRSAVDIDAVQIVAKSSQVTATGDITSTSEAMIGFQGLSAYEVWLKDNPDKTKEDYYNWLRQPATDAVSLIDDKIEHLDEIIDSSTENEAERVGAETLRLQSENLRISAETERKANEVERLANEASRASEELIREANESSRKQDEATRKTNENERETAETTRVSNENNRVTAEQARVQTEIVREQQEQARQTNTAIAIENANNAKGWTPSTVFEEYNGKQIKKLIGYIGGTGVEPTANVGQYYTENGFTNNKELAVNFRGTDGVDGDSIVNINPSSTMQQARIWVGTRNEYDIQKPLPNDVITFIL